MHDAQTLNKARWAVSAVFFANGAMLSGWLGHLDFIQRRLGLGTDRLGMVLLASTIGIVLTLPFAGVVNHRFGSRQVSIISAWCMAALIPFLPWASSIWVFAPILFVAGASSGQMDVAMNTHSVVVQDRFPKPILSAIHGWFSLGGFFGGATASLSRKLEVFPSIHVAVWSALMVAVVMVASRWMLRSDGGHQDDGPKFAAPRGPVLILGLLVMGCFVGEGAMWDWSAVHVRNMPTALEWMAPLALGIANGGTAFSRFLGDAIIARFGDRRLMIVSAWVGASGMALAALAPSPLFALIGFGLAGLGVGNLVPIVFKAASRLKGIPAATALSAVTSMGYASFLGAPPLIGAVADRISLATSLTGVAGLLGVVAVVSGRTIQDMPSEGAPRDAGTPAGTHSDLT